MSSTNFQSVRKGNFPMQAVLPHYDIGEVTQIHAAGGTAGKCWRVLTPSGNYFLRRRGLRTSSPEALAFDHGLRAHLLAHGVPTAAPLMTRNGETWVRTDEGVFELYPFVSGRAYQGSEEELEATAQALARFHLMASSYPARGTYTPVPKQFHLAAPEVGGSERIDDPTLVAAAFAALARTDPAMTYAAGQAAALAAEYSERVYGALPRFLTHGDYHPGNLLYSDSGEVAGLFDLDWACEHIRARDLADALYFFTGRRRASLDGGNIISLTDGVALDREKSLRFLHVYQKMLPLSKAELVAIPLALKARVLAMRLEGSAKVPSEQRVWFITRDLEQTLRWVEEQNKALCSALGELP